MASTTSESSLDLILELDCLPYLRNGEMRIVHLLWPRLTDSGKMRKFSMGRVVKIKSQKSFFTLINHMSSDYYRYGLLRGTLRAPAVGWMMYNVLVSNEKAIQSQYKSHVYADPENVTPNIIESRFSLTKRKGARYVPAAFLTGLLDPVTSRKEFLELFAGLEGKFPVLVVSTASSPKRSKAEMEALRQAKGVSKFIEVPGALLPQEEYPGIIAEELYKFLQEI